MPTVIWERTTSEVGLPQPQQRTGLAFNHICLCHGPGCAMAQAVPAAHVAQHPPQQVHKPGFNVYSPVQPSTWSLLIIKIPITSEANLWRPQRCEVTCTDPHLGQLGLQLHDTSQHLTCLFAKAWCGLQVLTMEYCPGTKINRIEQLDAMGVDKQRLARLAVESYLQQILTHGFFHAGESGIQEVQCPASLGDQSLSSVL